MKLKTPVIAASLLALLCSCAQAAKELTPEQAASLKPFERITITGRYNSIGDAVAAVSTRADTMGAAYFFVQGSNESNNGCNIKVTADLYHADAAKVDPEAIEHKTYDGVTELSQKEANTLVPFDTVTVSGFFGSQPNINAAIAKLAQQKGAASFAIVRQIDTNTKGGTVKATAFIYKADAPKRAIQDPNAIPADSTAGQAALAKGGEAAKQVEIPGLASSSTVGVGRFFETQTSQGGRYAVTLEDGTRIEELNNATAAQMALFDSITFTGHFSSVTDMSYQVAKRAAAKGAKYYHLTRQWQSGQGGNLTVSADLFK